MFIAELADGRRLKESDAYWNDIPRNVEIVRLRAMLKNPSGVIVVDDGIEGFDAYGFQKYQVIPIQGPNQGKATSFGCQLIGIDRESGMVLTVDINPISNQRRAVFSKVDDLTYNRELLRNGRRG